MARDYAKKPKPAARRPRTTAKKKSGSPKKSGSVISGWQWFGAGLLTGIFFSFIVYLGSLPPDIQAGITTAQESTATAQKEPPKPRFDFYTLLPEQTMDVEIDPAEVVTARASKTSEFFLLQAGSFKQKEDADRRRAQLLLLGLEPNIEETNGDNGRWYRVYLGPFQSKSRLSKARSLTAAQNIDTLLLKRGGA
ncbi:MAG: hypothetical protein ACJAZ0_000911 [Halioglobus sp.]|jgi:hypothetical protein